MNMRWTIAAAVGLIVGCEQDAPPPDNTQSSAARSQVVTTCYPIYSILRQIADDAIDVRLLSLPINHQRPSSPDENQVKDIQQAAMIFLNGSGYEAWADRISLPRSRMTDLSDGLRELQMRDSGRVTHQHGPDGANDQSNLLWATWLEPKILMQQTQSMETVLKRLQPKAAETITKQTKLLVAQLQSIDDKLGQRRASLSQLDLQFWTDQSQLAYLIPQTELTMIAMSDWQAQTQTVSADAKIAMLHAHELPSEFRKWLQQRNIPIIPIDLCDRESDDKLLVRLNRNIEALGTLTQIDPEDDGH